MCLYYLFSQAKQWGQQLLGIRGAGYSAAVVMTPYIHTLIYYVHEMLRLYSSLAVFAGQGTLTSLYSYIQNTFKPILKQIIFYPSFLYQQLKNDEFR